MSLEDSMGMEDLRIPISDGFRLAVTLYTPSGLSRSNDYMALIAPAAAVKRSYYEQYARFLAEEGFSVVTFDYRGVGGSRPNHLSGFEAYMHEWGEKDIAGVIEWMEYRLHSKRLLIIAHSVGGQLVALASNNFLINAMLIVASQSGYWKLYRSPERYRQYIFSKAIVPILTKIYGFLPAKILGEDLPKGISLEWARWSQIPNYLFGDDQLPSRYNVAQFRAPILAYSFEDDKWASPEAVDNLMTFYSNSYILRRHVSPADLAAPFVGHFGFFKPKFRETLWCETLKWLRQQ